MLYLQCGVHIEGTVVLVAHITNAFLFSDPCKALHADDHRLSGMGDEHAIQVGSD